MRSMLSITAALAVFAGAFAVIPPGPYKFDAKGNCHAASGMMIAPALCHSALAARPVCKKGKPCGNSCIAQDKVCHK